MIQNSLIEDISALTTIPQTSLNSLSNKAIYCICNDIEEAVLSQDDELSIKMGIGTLKIKIIDDVVEYRFEPSKELEKNVNNTIIDKKNPLVATAEKTLVKRIVTTYKDFI